MISPCKLFFAYKIILMQGHDTTNARQRTAKIKLLVIFSYYFLYLAITQTALTISLRNQPKFEARLATYFSCELTGMVPGKTCERSFERLTDSAAIAISFLILGLYPMVNLVFVVNVKELKMCCGKQRERFSNSTTSQNGSMNITLQ